MAAAAAAAAGASAAVAYCHVRRSAQEKVARGAAGGLYGFYAHTDQAEGSWAARLPELVSAGGGWAEQRSPESVE